MRSVVLERWQQSILDVLGKALEGSDPVWMSLPHSAITLVVEWNGFDGHDDCERERLVREAAEPLGRDVMSRVPSIVCLTAREMTPRMIYVVYAADRGDLTSHIPGRIEQPPGGQARRGIEPEWWLQRVSRPVAYGDRVVVALMTVPGGTIASGFARQHLQATLTWVTLLPEELTDELSGTQRDALPEHVRGSARGERPTLADVIQRVRERFPDFPKFPRRVYPA